MHKSNKNNNDVCYLTIVLIAVHIWKHSRHSSSSKHSSFEQQLITSTNHLWVYKNIFWHIGQHLPWMQTRYSINVYCEGPTKKERERENTGSLERVGEEAKALLFPSVPYSETMRFVYIQSLNLNDFIPGLHPLDLVTALVHSISGWREWVSKPLVRKLMCWKSPGDSFMERMAGALPGQREEQSQEGIRSICKPASHCFQSDSFCQVFHLGWPRATIAWVRSQGHLPSSGTGGGPREAVSRKHFKKNTFY